MRSEQDSIGEWNVEDEALYGIHSARAKDNFPDNTPFSVEWYKAVGTVKLACYNTYEKFKQAAQEKTGARNFSWINRQTIEALKKSAEEVSLGLHFKHFIVPAIQGGAGTSINMNVNEIIANRALELTGETKGNYKLIDPFEHSNIYQSTNDVIPTSLKVASLKLLNDVQEKINHTRQAVENLEKKYYNNLRIGYTQMQEAVPSSFGRLFSTYSDALSRDWWRVSKCSERIKTVNLGGGAIGTGVAIPRYFIMEVVKELQHLTGLPITRAENLEDATANLDSLVEVHAIIKSHAVNLEKMVSDLRLLSSDTGTRDISIPAKQAGSSIMPGKINPVIPEFVISAAHKVYANDNIITSLSAQGCLNLNAYLPIIGHSLLDSLKILISANISVTKNLLENLSLNTELSLTRLYHSPAITTALVPHIGYNKATKLASEIKNTGCNIFEANSKLHLIDGRKLNELLQPENLLKLGFSLDDLSE